MKNNVLAAETRSPCVIRWEAEGIPQSGRLRAIYNIVKDRLCKYMYWCVNTATLARNDALIQLHLLEATHEYSYTR